MQCMFVCISLSRTFVNTFSQPTATANNSNNCNSATATTGGHKSNVHIRIYATCRDKQVSGLFIALPLWLPVLT